MGKESRVRYLLTDMRGTFRITRESPSRMMVGVEVVFCYILFSMVLCS